jgi:hypothetical protein
MDQLSTLALAAALAWASGIRLYAVIFLVGLVGQQQWISLPEHLKILSHHYVLLASGLLLLLEFFADKIPGIDSVWDAIHTFVRIPAGALLAAGVIGANDGAAWMLAAGLLGGTITAGTHFTKAGSRAVINTSPEPISNWTASLTEDALTVGGLWLAIAHPLVFLLLLALFVALMVWLLPKLWRLIVRLSTRLVGLVGLTAQTAPAGKR